MDLHHIRRGSGPPLLLVHGLGGSWRSWDPILPALELEREVIAVDLPGFGATPPLADPTVPALADALDSFLDAQDLKGVAAAGTSLGARLVLELARRGSVGATVALDPGGFWATQGERRFFGTTVALSIRLVRLLQPVMPALTRNPVARTLLFAQFSARPWALPGDAMLTEMRSYAAAPSFDAVLRNLARGPGQPGTDATPGPVVIGWGRRDLVTLPRQAARAQQRFPNARLTWFERSGHFPFLDVPEEATRVILGATA